MNEPIHDIKIDWDDDAISIIDKFSQALADKGIVIEDVTPSPDAPSLYLKILEKP